MKQRRTLLFPLATAALLALAAAGGPTLQGRTAPAATAPAPDSGQPAAAARTAPTQEGPAHEEAAHHPEVTLFGRPLGTLAKFGVQVINFIIFAAILMFFLKGVLAAAFKARTRELEDKLSQAERDKAAAAAQVQELDNRMAGLQQELAGILAKAEADAQQERERILASARAEAAQILAQTQVDIQAQQRQAEGELRALVAGLAVEGAARRLESSLREGTDSAAQVLDRAIEQVGGAK
jgi:F-type H+-transporting ATPase subunit b